MNQVHKERLKWIIALLNQLDDDMTGDNDDNFEVQEAIMDVKRCSMILRVALDFSVENKND